MKADRIEYGILRIDTHKGMSGRFSTTRITLPMYRLAITVQTTSE